MTPMVTAGRGSPVVSFGKSSSGHQPVAPHGRSPLGVGVQAERAVGVVAGQFQQSGFVQQLWLLPPERDRRAGFDAVTCEIAGRAPWWGRVTRMGAFGHYAECLRPQRRDHGAHRRLGLTAGLRLRHGWRDRQLSFNIREREMISAAGCEPGCQGLRCGPVGGGDGLGVEPEGQADIGVSEPDLSGLRVDALGHHPGGVHAAKIMELETRKTRPLACRYPDASAASGCSSADRLDGPRRATARCPRR